MIGWVPDLGRQNIPPGGSPMRPLGLRATTTGPSGENAVSAAVRARRSACRAGYGEGAADSQYTTACSQAATALTAGL